MLETANLSRLFRWELVTPLLPIRNEFLSCLYGSERCSDAYGEWLTVV